MSHDDADPDARQERDLTDALLDVVLYAPIGLVLDAETLTPELARRGRQHAAAARQIGELAVKQGLRRLDEVLAQVAGSAPGGTAPSSNGAGKAAPAPPDVEAEPEIPPPSADHLAIPDYDLLAASQVVKRLEGLDPSELEAVRVYEAATRDRRTILHKIARLQD